MMVGEAALAALAHLVDLRLQVVHHLWRNVVTKDLEEVDLLVAGDGFNGCQLDAFLHLKIPYRLKLNLKLVFSQ